MLQDQIIYVYVCSVKLHFAAPLTAAHQAPLSVGFSRKNTAMRCHFLLQGTFPPPGTEPASLSPLGLADRFFTTLPP